MVLNGLIPIDTQVSTGQSLKAASGRLLHNGVIRGDFKSATEISYGLIASPKSFKDASSCVECGRAVRVEFKRLFCVRHCLFSFTCLE